MSLSKSDAGDNLQTCTAGSFLSPLSHHPARSWAGGGTGTVPPPGIRHLSGQSLVGMWAWLRGAHVQAEQGCRKLESGPAVASLGQSQSDMRSWDMDRVGGSHGGWEETARPIRVLRALTASSLAKHSLLSYVNLPLLSVFLLAKRILSSLQSCGNVKGEEWSDQYW